MWSWNPACCELPWKKRWKTFPNLWPAYWCSERYEIGISVKIYPICSVCPKTCQSCFVVIYRLKPFSILYSLFICLVWNLVCLEIISFRMLLQLLVQHSVFVIKVSVCLIFVYMCLFASLKYWYISVVTYTW